MIDGRLNNGFKAVNELLAAGASVSRVDQAQAGLRIGDFIVAKGAAVAPDREGDRSRILGVEHRPESRARRTR